MLPPGTHQECCSGRTLRCTGGNGDPKVGNGRLAIASEFHAFAVSYTTETADRRGLAAGCPALAWPFDKLVILHDGAPLAERCADNA